MKISEISKNNFIWKVVASSASTSQPTKLLQFFEISLDSFFCKFRADKSSVQVKINRLKMVIGSLSFPDFLLVVIGLWKLAQFLANWGLNWPQNYIFFTIFEDQFLAGTVHNKISFGVLFSCASLMSMKNLLVTLCHVPKYFWPVVLQD